MDRYWSPFSLPRPCVEPSLFHAAETQQLPSARISLAVCSWAAFCLPNALIPSLPFCPFNPFSIRILRVAYQGGLDAENTRESGLPPSHYISFAS